MLKRKIIEFASTADGAAPLFAETAWDDQQHDLPLVAVMTGFNGTRANVEHCLDRFAEQGLCAVSIDMRGRDQSAGRPDCGAVEIHDINDALDAAARALQDYVDPDRCCIVGYSGGGGNTMSAVTKFPDRFQVAVSFFGISDYEYWFRSRGRPDCNQRMVNWVGGSPEELPHAYRARNSAAAAGNCPNTEMHLFWDQEEIDCPGPMNDTFAANARHAGNQNVFCHLSKTTDKHRWFHGYPQDHPSLIAAEDIFIPRILERNVSLSLPTTGRLVVPGYLVTKHFSFWIGDGRQNAATIEYDLTKPIKLTQL